jgi:predicted PurR-regulated permease PerM
MHVIGSAVNTAGAIFFVLFLTLFVQLGGRGWYESALGLAPDSGRERLRRVGTGISEAVGGFVTGNLLISVIAGSVATLVLFALSVPCAVPLGLLVAIFDLIPLVGATVGTVLVACVALSALAIALSVAAGAELGGVVGALLGIPFAGALKVAARELIAWQRGENAPV